MSSLVSCGNQVNIHRRHNGGGGGGGGRGTAN